MKFLQKLGKALMLPVAVLPICGILMGIGYYLCPATMQGGEVELLKLFVIEQRVKQGVDPGHRGEGIFRQLFDQAWNIARVGDQQILPAQLDKQQAVHGQRENVIQR